MSNQSKYQKKDEKRQIILNAALKLAMKKGFSNIRRDEVADEAGVADGSVNYCFNNMNELLNTVVDEAVKKKELKVIGQALVAGNERAIFLTVNDKELKKAALMSLA